MSSMQKRQQSMHWQRSSYQFTAFNNCLRRFEQRLAKGIRHMAYSSNQQKLIAGGYKVFQAFALRKLRRQECSFRAWL